MTTSLVILFLFSPKKEGRRKEKLFRKIVIKSHAFLLDRKIDIGEKEIERVRNRETKKRDRKRE